MRKFLIVMLVLAGVSLSAVAAAHCMGGGGSSLNIPIDLPESMKIEADVGYGCSRSSFAVGATFHVKVHDPDIHKRTYLIGGRRDYITKVESAETEGPFTVLSSSVTKGEATIQVRADAVGSGKLEVSLRTKKGYLSKKRALALDARTPTAVSCTAIGNTYSAFACDGAGAVASGGAAPVLLPSNTSLECYPVAFSGDERVWLPQPLTGTASGAVQISPLSSDRCAQNFRMTATGTGPARITWSDPRLAPIEMELFDLSSIDALRVDAAPPNSDGQIALDVVPLVRGRVPCKWGTNWTASVPASSPGCYFGWRGTKRDEKSRFLVTPARGGAACDVTVQHIDPKRGVLLTRKSRLDFKEWNLRAALDRELAEYVRSSGQPAPDYAEARRQLRGLTPDTYLVAGKSGHPDNRGGLEAWIRERDKGTHEARERRIVTVFVVKEIASNFRSFTPSLTTDWSFRNTPPERIAVLQNEERAEWIRSLTEHAAQSELGLTAFTELCGAPPVLSAEVCAHADQALAKRFGPR